MNKINNIITRTRSLTLLALLCLLGGYIYHVTKTNQESNKIALQNKLNALSKIDSEIAQNDIDTDSIWENRQNFINQTLNQNENYSYVHENKKQFDSLAKVNERLLNQAYSLASKSTIFNLTPRTTKLFTDYKNIPAIQKISNQYYANQKKMREFEKRNRAINNFEAKTRNYCDSVILAKTRILQKQKDSLLRKKQELMYSL